jgi:Flp pilus assembly protein TadD
MQKKLEAKPTDQRLRLSLVSHLEAAGRYEEAVLHARKAVRFNPESRRAKGMLLRLRLEQRLASIHRTRI